MLTFWTTLLLSSWTRRHFSYFLFFEEPPLTAVGLGFWLAFLMSFFGLPPFFRGFAEEIRLTADRLVFFFYGRFFCRGLFRLPVIRIHLNRFFRGPDRKNLHCRKPVTQGFPTLYINEFFQVHLLNSFPLPFSLR